LRKHGSTLKPVSSECPFVWLEFFWQSRCRGITGRTPADFTKNPRSSLKPMG
jgi:hypothetical protein